MPSIKSWKTLKNSVFMQYHLFRNVSEQITADIAGAVRNVASRESVVEFTSIVLKTLRSKHPSSPNDLRPVSVPSSFLHISATSSDVVNAMKSFVGSSSGGIYVLPA